MFHERSNIYVYIAPSAKRLDHRLTTTDRRRSGREPSAQRRCRKRAAHEQCSRCCCWLPAAACVSALSLRVVALRCGLAAESQQQQPRRIAADGSRACRWFSSRTKRFERHRIDQQLIGENELDDFRRNAKRPFTLLACSYIASL